MKGSLGASITTSKSFTFHERLLFSSHLPAVENSPALEGLFFPTKFLGGDSIQKCGFELSSRDVGVV